MSGGTVLDRALELCAERGLPLVPCDANKKPLLRDWTGVEVRSLDQVEAAFSAPGVELIGVRTGSVSNLLVIDIDPRNGGDPWYAANFEKLNCKRLHRTRSGGLHLLYRMPDQPIRNSANKLGEGVDVRADGGQIIWWPAYDFDVLLDDEPGPAPAWLLQALTQGTRTDKHPDIGRKLESGIAEGGRNAGLTKIAGKLRREGLSPGELSAALGAVNQERCNPPLPDSEVQTIAKSVGRYKPADTDERPPVAFGEIIVPSMADLVQTNVAPRTWFFEQIIPAGAFLYVGRPKIGKSWFLMQLALAYSRGDSFLGYQCLEPGGVLYIAAEDDASRMKERFTLTGQTIPPTNLHVMVGEQFRALADQYGHLRLVEFLDGYLRAHPDVKMVLGDTEATMRAIWDGASKGLDIKAKDYGETREFDRLALEHRAFVALVNHTSKRRSGGYLDLHELVNRTNVALAGCSGSLVMADPPNREVGDDEDKVRILGIRGRDLRDDILLAVEQDETGMFRSLGLWSAVAATAAEREILEAALELHHENPEGWIKSKAISEAIGKQAGTVRRTVSRMLKANRNVFEGYRIETRTSKGLRLVSMYGEKP